ncbi:hypothetical protein FRC17_004968, partial [Serendipita sp. 399]
MEEEEGLLGNGHSSGHSNGHAYKRRSRHMLHGLRGSISIKFILTAMCSGLIFYLLVFSVILSRPSLKATSQKYIFGDPQYPPSVYPWDDGTHNGSSAGFPFPDSEHWMPRPFPSLTTNGLLELSLDELKAMVDSTNGYFVRDWSLGLGWNNMRYIIEGALLQARLVNRTLVLPSFVYSRACEYHNEVCARYAKMVNRNDAIGTNEWKDLPLEKQMAWVIPMEMMMDIPYLRKHHNVMLMTEYFRLENLDFNREIPNGRWDRQYYHTGDNRPSLYVVPNNIYDPDDIARIDTIDAETLAELGSERTPDGKLFDEKLLEKSRANKKAVVGWKDARDVLASFGHLPDDKEMETLLQRAGWITLYTYEGDLGMDFTKTVVNPIKQTARYSTLRAWRGDFINVKEKVMLLEGEVHLGRKPGFVRYTTKEARYDFARIVLHDIRPPPNVVALAIEADRRMNKVNDGRAWMAAHMRRGDFVKLGWMMEASIENHYKRIQDRLAKGRKTLEEISTLEPEIYDVPDTEPNMELLTRKPPRDGDFIYLATDERDEASIKYLKEHKAILFNDVVTMDDRRKFGWGLLFTDIISLAEQQIIGHGSSYFYAHAMSSVAGGIVNFRAANG